MKKILSLILLFAMTFSMVACSNNDDGSSTENNSSNDGTVVLENGVKVEFDEPVPVEDATELLSFVWQTYGEEEVFAIMGGDYNNTVENEPGKFDVADTESLDSVLGVTADSAALIDDAASMVHMMNANTFTAGAFHLSDPANQQQLADSIKENLVNRQWMCGFPDKLVIYAVGEDYVVAAFGAEEVIETFKAKLQSLYAAAYSIYEESLVVE